MENSAVKTSVINRPVKAESSATKVIENCYGEKEKLVCCFMLTAMDSASLLLLLYLGIKRCWPSSVSKDTGQSTSLLS